MKRLVQSGVVGLTALILVSSCSPSFEAQGDRAYRAAQKQEGDTRRRLEKEAYMYYQKALKAQPGTVSVGLRNRFLELTLDRAVMVLTEGSAHMGALPLFMEDLDEKMTPEVDPALRTRYADFLVMLADSSFANQKIYRGVGYLDKALAIVPERGPIDVRKKAVLDNMAADNYEMGKMEYENGRKAPGQEEDVDALIRAEYRVQLALYYDPAYPGAAELLSKIYQENVNKYSAYEKVVEDRPDTTIYRAVNKYDIFMAISAVTGSTLKVDMYNYSYNPLRLRPSDFAIIDAAGKKYPALASSKIDKEILDQEHEAKLILHFPKIGGKMKRLEYRNEEHYTEKNFF